MLSFFYAYPLLTPVRIISRQETEAAPQPSTTAHSSVPIQGDSEIRIRIQCSCFAFYGFWDVSARGSVQTKFAGNYEYQWIMDYVRSDDVIWLKM